MATKETDENESRFLVRDEFFLNTKKAANVLHCSPTQNVFQDIFPSNQRVPLPTPKVKPKLAKGR
jgi:hypothetical protein